MQIFLDMCTLNDGQYFLCNFEDQIENAALIDHLPIKIKSKYIFSTSPISNQNLFVATRLVNFARAYSENETVTIENLKNNLRWSSLGIPENIESLVHLENIYDVLDLYLWLGFRFPTIFPYQEQVKEMRIELESLVEKGIERFLGEKKKNTSFRTTYVRSVNKPKDKNSYTSEKLKNLQIEDSSKFNNLIQNNNPINTPNENPDVKQSTQMSSKSALVNNNQTKLTKIEDSEILVEKTSIQSTDKSLVKNQITSNKITRNDLVERKNNLKDKQQSKPEVKKKDPIKNDCSIKNTENVANDLLEQTEVKHEIKSGDNV